MLYVLDSTFKKVATIDVYESLIWTKRARACGDFELYMRATEEAYNKLFSASPRYLVREKDVLGSTSFRNVMRIDGRNSLLEIKSEEDKGVFMTVKGSDLKSLVYQRIITPQTALQNAIPELCSSLLNLCIIDPTDTDRAISNFIRGADDLVNTPETIDRQWTGDNLGEAIQELLDTENLMFDIAITSNQFVFSLYEGRDHSYAQSTNDLVVFSTSFENLVSTDYKSGKGDSYANAAYVGGEGEGLDRKVVGVGATTGTDRYEMWVDARNSSSNEGEISDADYTAQLKQEGTEAITEAKDASASTFDAEIDLTTSPFKYGTDFKLNDVVQVVGGWMSSAARVIEVIESESDSGITTVAKLSVN